MSNGVPLWWLRYRMKSIWWRYGPTTWKQRIWTAAVRFANALERRWFPTPDPKPIGGKYLEFQPAGSNLGHVRYRCISKRGRMGMGTVEWSNQWGRPRFKAHPEAVFDQQCIAEIYACMREMK